MQGRHSRTKTTGANDHFPCLPVYRHSHPFKHTYLGRTTDLMSSRAYILSFCPCSSTYALSNIHIFNLLLLKGLQEDWASFSNAVKKNLRGISSELDLGQHLAFMKVFSSGICSELQKTFRTRNSSRNSARVFSNAIP